MKKKHFIAGLQYVRESADPQQVHLNYENRYYQPEEHANILAGQVGWRSLDKNIKITGAYLHGFDTGRFLFPKELTREGFYVSQPRSWVEGFGQVDIIAFRSVFQFKKSGWSNWSLDTRLQHIITDGCDDYQNNKYGTPSSFQGILLVNYSPKKFLTGVHLTFMYVQKYTPDSVSLTYAQTFYKTNLHHFNIIMNVYF